MKKILYIATRPISPMKDGRTYLLEQYCKVFSEEFGYEVYVAAFDQMDPQIQPTYLTGVYELQEPNLLEAGFNILIRTFFCRWPIQASLMFSATSQRKIDRLLKLLSPDIVICDMARTAPYVWNKTCFKILDMEDLLSKRYYRQAEIGQNGAEALGQYGAKMPAIVRKFLVKFNAINFFLRVEAKLMKAFEKKAYDKFDNTFFCSPIDTRQFNEVFHATANCVHVAVENEKIVEKKSIKSIDKNCLLYLGNIEVSANRKSLALIIDEILPRIREVDNDIYLLVVGNCTKHTAESLKAENVIFTYRVEDVAPYLSKGLCLIAPLTYGSGIKIKILEAMANGVPVVTNSIGTEGLEVVSGENVIICENISDYVNAVQRLKVDDKFWECISKNEIRYIKNNHSIRRVREDFRFIIE